MLTVKGKVIFDPENKTRKHESQSKWKRVVLIQLDCETYAYYAWFVNRRYNLILNRPLRGTHVTIVNDVVDRSELYDAAKAKYNGKLMEFTFDPDARTNGEHWWLRVSSNEAEDLREEIGLTRKPYFNLHLTLGHANEKHIAHAEYIHKCVQMYGA